ncbi:MAG TPA: hypothetical protein PKB06_02935, partial [Actinotalea sp.]|nr:hypothetical protein [Actinotalea sp.]
MIAPVLSGRRSREIAGVALLLVLAGAYLAFGRLTSDLEVSAAGVRDVLERGASGLGWTPLGAAWAVPADVAAGSWGSAGARLAILVPTIAVLAAAWDRALARALVRPPSSGPRGGTSVKGLGWFARLPDSPAGAVAARSVTYWFRDPRYSVAIAAVPFMPLVMWAFGIGEGVV